MGLDGGAAGEKGARVPHRYDQAPKGKDFKGKAKGKGKYYK